MRFSLSLSAAVFTLMTLTGCASQSELTSIWLDPDHPQYKSRDCQNSLATADRHREAKTASAVATPALLLLSGGLLLPVVAVNAGLDAADRFDASDMAANCGSKGQNASEIAKDVAIGATLGAAASVPAR